MVEQQSLPELGWTPCFQQQLTLDEWEQAFNGASIAEKRAKDRDLGKFYRSVQAESTRLKKGQ